MRCFVLLGGLFGPDGWLVSRGMIGLASQIQALGIKTSIHPWNDYGLVVHLAEVVPVSEKLILVGYSGGGAHATWAANAIARHTDLLVAYDPSPSYQVIRLPIRVNKAICFYNSASFMFGLGGGRLTGDHVKLYPIAQQHLAVQYNEELHKITLAAIKELL